MWTLAFPGDCCSLDPLVHSISIVWTTCSLPFETLFGSIFSVQLSPDSNFGVLCGSDDTHSRIWKAEGSFQETSLRASAVRMEYNESPKERDQHFREINCISEHGHVAKAIKKAVQTKREASARDQKKMANHRAHAKRGRGGAAPH
ncbi:hypothetical protein PsorP6_010352 [Peronosclerospora sorghi]|uniref:Uncharacterized protein n=1 Tax=Peronosclerospora sorghi TaxID=230839 RepID=A0ACC0VUC7_9STRA|nr:hypothetical protein PsorP6_010352 [Peronosclerospora sorghi]